MTRVRDEYRQNQSPAQALAHLRLVAGAPIARPALPSLEIIFRFLFRCSPETDMAAFTDPRRSDRRVFAAELPMASSRDGISGGHRPRGHVDNEQITGEVRVQGEAELRSLTNGLPSRINVCTRRKRTCGPQGGSPGLTPRRSPVS